jgi:hypothetical protein
LEIQAVISIFIKLFHHFLFIIPVESGMIY